MRNYIEETAWKGRIWENLEYRTDPIGTIQRRGEGRSLIKRLGDMLDGPRRARLSGDPRTYK